MNAIVSPSEHGPPSPDAVPAELKHANSSESIKEFQQFDVLQSPFHELGSDELLEELWEEGANKQFKPLSYWPKNRGNYVRSYVLSNLRIHAKATRPKVRWNLEALWDTLPVELIISIFEFLHPIDLYHAIRATKGLRRFLLDRNSTSIWKQSFANHPDIPLYPPDISAPKWVSLIFGPATCDSCGSDNTLVDYTSRLRKCDTCTDYLYFEDEDMLGVAQPIIEEFPNQLNHLLDLPKKIYHFSPFLYAREVDYELETPKSSLKEFTERVHEMHKYLLDIRSGTANAQTKYQSFLSVTRAAVQERMKQAKTCGLWAQNIYANCNLTFIGSVPVFCAKGEKALLKQGHDPRDVKEARDIFTATMIEFKYAEISDPVLSRSKLWKYLPELESILQECRRRRLMDECAQRASARRGQINTFYWKTIKAFLTREKAPFLPYPQKLYKLQFFVDYIDDPKESVGELDTLSAQQQILRFIEALWARRKQQLFKVLLETALLPKEAVEYSNPDDFLGLAIAVFECCLYSVHVGWEDAGIHNCFANSVGDVDSVGLFHFSHIGHQALMNLAELLHLDLRFALAKDLDVLNKRFICKTCKFHRQARLHGAHSMTWRECLTHATQMSSVSSEDPHHVVFDVLSETLTVFILTLEQPFPPPADENWVCKHCSTWSDPVKRAEVIAHAKTVHAITKPIQGVDFVYCRTESCSKRTPLFIGLDEHSNHRCLRCPSYRPRLWTKTPDMFRHILDKHAIQSKDLVEGVDWIKVKAVEDTSWIEEKMRVEGIIIA